MHYKVGIFHYLSYVMISLTYVKINRNIRQGCSNICQSYEPHRSWWAPYMLRIGITYVMIAPIYLKFEYDVCQGREQVQLSRYPSKNFKIIF